MPSLSDVSLGRSRCSVNNQLTSRMRVSERSREKRSISGECMPLLIWWVDCAVEKRERQRDKCQLDEWLEPCAFRYSRRVKWKCYFTWKNWFPLFLVRILIDHQSNWRVICKYKHPFHSGLSNLFSSLPLSAHLFDIVCQQLLLHYIKGVFNQNLNCFQWTNVNVTLAYLPLAARSTLLLAAGWLKYQSIVRLSFYSHSLVVIINCIRKGVGSNSFLFYYSTDHSNRNRICV